MNEKGFSYVEVLITAMVLSICLVPIVSSFYQSARNFSYARDMYIANSLVENLTIEIESGIKGKGIIPDLDNHIWEFINCPNPEKAYRTDIFKYKIHIGGLETKEFEYGAEMILYDNGFPDGTDKLLLMNNDSPGDEYFTVVVDNLDHEIEISVENKSDKRIYVNIYKSKMIDEKKIKINYLPNRNEIRDQIFTQILSKPQNSMEFTIVVELFNMNDSLLKRQVKLCYL